MKREITDKDRLDFIKKYVMSFKKNEKGNLLRKSITISEQYQNEFVFYLFEDCVGPIYFYGKTLEEAIDNAIMAMREEDK